MSKKLITLVIFLGTLLVFSIFYNLFLKDFLRNRSERQCFNNAENNLNNSIENINSLKGEIVKSRDALIAKRPEILSELDKLARDIEQNEFKNNKEQMDIINNKVKDMTVPSSSAGNFIFAKLYHKSEGQIRQEVYNHQKDSFVRDNPQFKQKDEESQKTEEDIKNLENKLKSLDRDIQISKEKYDQYRNYCLKRF